ncbi:transposable element Tcb1 transposase [Trichonephila clavipes]|nr:transposable element Tcb1 transposase [Trichonephila clavipes]
MSRRKQRSAFDQVSEFSRGGIVAYRDYGLSSREIGSRVRRNQTTVIRICDRWMQEGKTDRRGRSHLSTSGHHFTVCAYHSTPFTAGGLSTRRPLIGLPLTQNHRRLRRQRCDQRRCGWQNGMKLFLLTSHASVCNTTMVGFESGDTITPPAATPDQIWQRVEAALSAVPQEYIQSLFESMPRRVTTVISNNGGYSGY